MNDYPLIKEKIFNAAQTKKLLHGINKKNTPPSKQPLKAIDPPNHISKIKRHEVVNTIRCSYAKWCELSHEEKYHLAIQWGFKSKDGKYLVNTQPKYHPDKQNFLPL